MTALRIAAGVVLAPVRFGIMCAAELWLWGLAAWVARSAPALGTPLDESMRERVVRLGPPAVRTVWQCLALVHRIPPAIFPVWSVHACGLCTRLRPQVMQGRSPELRF